MCNLYWSGNNTLMVSFQWLNDYDHQYLVWSSIFGVAKISWVLWADWLFWLAELSSFRCALLSRCTIGGVSISWYQPRQMMHGWSNFLLLYRWCVSHHQSHDISPTNNARLMVWTSFQVVYMVLTSRHLRQMEFRIIKYELTLGWCGLFLSYGFKC